MLHDLNKYIILLIYSYKHIKKKTIFDKRNSQKEDLRKVLKEKYWLFYVKFSTRNINKQIKKFDFKIF